MVGSSSSSAIVAGMHAPDALGLEEAKERKRIEEEMRHLQAERGREARELRLMAAEEELVRSLAVSDEVTVVEEVLLCGKYV